MTKIRANEIKLVELSEITPHPENANRHSPEQIKRLAKMIEFSGFREPLTISNLSGFLICGHGRLDAAKLLGIDRVPVIFQDFENEAMEYQHLIGENEIARWAELDWQSLYDNMKELELDPELLGINNFKVPDEIKEEIDKEIDIDFAYKIEIDCNSEDNQKNLQQELEDRGFKVRLLL